MKGKPLVETMQCKWTIVQEEQSSEGKIVTPMQIGGTASKGNATNENKRHYKTSLWKREAKRLQDDVGRGKFLGELDHPIDGKSRLKAMKFTKLFMDGDYLKFEAEVLETLAGKDLKALIRGGVEVDVSTRGFGSTKEKKISGSTVDDVQDDYELAGIDAVSGHSNLEAEIEYFKERKNNLKGGDEMKIDELKKEHPELYAQVVKETEDRVTKEVTEKLTKDFEDKVIDEIAKTRTEMTEEITASVKEELMPEHEENQAKLVEVADIVSDFIEGSSGNTPDEKDEKLQAMEQKLDAATSKFETLDDDLKTAQGLIAKSEVKEYLDETLKNEPFKAVLKKRLEDCKTKEDVDKRLPEEKDYVQKIIQENETPSGKGEALNEDEKDKTSKDEHDELEQRQRRLAGVDG